MMLRIKNWKRFQHFKDRRPPWIKLYRDILDDLEWHELDGQSAKFLLMIWLIASEDGPMGEGRVPCVKELAFRLRSTEKQVESCISKLSHWLERDDITTISERYQNDLPETETETETEKRQITVIRPKSNGRFTIPTIEDVSEYCRARKNSVDPVKFHAFYTSNGWKVGKNPMRKWKAAIVTWERNQ
jgi:hypothetical protein